MSQHTAAHVGGGPAAVGGSVVVELGGPDAAGPGGDPGRPERLPDVTTADLRGALDELLDTRNAMTRVLLGGRPDHAPAD
ncbi:hypothetical protein [Cellulomonas aerilata]|uniref:Uncharacterized protein n=1 Tax=Cellulomonas aerilata TaxID=515326 RepID=A0A512D7H2_9CELL|nr:hypothetical protein [Cellulomonas aerilata]GEO32419.1 hypothetical protein CAE01nite_01440 [Cellulomonas aerilata]